MKITVVTPYDSANFGAYLQAYCLKKHLEDCGHQVFHIPTRSEDYVRELYFRTQPKSKKEMLFRKAFDRQAEFGKRKYEIFRKEQQVFQIVKNYRDTDLVVLGSDEIWNLQHSVFRNSLFWGDISKPTISYAASMGSYPEERMERNQDQIQQLKHLKAALVRDENTKRMVENVTDLKAQMVCDPTLLVPVESYGEEVADEYVVRNRCLLVYSYKLSKKEIAVIQRYAKEHHLKTVSCCFYHPWCDHQVECGPLAFSSLIRHCEAVFTTTFHGTIFSMLNHANFVTYSTKAKTNFLLEQFHVMGRRITGPLTCEALSKCYAEKIDYPSVEQEIQKWRVDSAKALDAAIRAEAKQEYDSLICFHNECTGCFACKAKCPVDAIDVQIDAYGRTVPKINPDKCIKCGACKRVCPQRNSPAFNQPLACYAARGNAENVIENCSSGGIAATLSKQFIENGDAVCGCVIADGIAKHTVVTDLDGLAGLKGSKYVQSNLSEAFKAIGDKLRENQRALFIGTPCQCAAMRKFYPANDKLFLIDIICHGVPPMQYLEQHLQKILPEKDYSHFSFRGGKPDYTLRVFQDKEPLYSAYKDEDSYFYAFMKCMNCRENCYSCKYAQENRIGDLTIGDFWGLDKSTLKNKYQGNISVVLVNTAKGEQLLEQVRDSLCLEERSISEAVAGNPQLRRPSLVHKDRQKFLEQMYITHDFDAAAAATSLPQEMKVSQKQRDKVHRVYKKVKKTVKRLVR